MTLLCAGIVLQRTATDLIESSLGNGEREKGKFLFGLRSSPVFLVSSSPSLKRLIRRKLCHGIFHFQNRIFSPNQKEISNPGGERRWWKMYGKCDGPGVIESHFGSETSDRKWKKRKVHSWWKIIRVSSVCNIPMIFSDTFGVLSCRFPRSPAKLFARSFEIGIPPWQTWIDCAAQMSISSFTKESL